MGITLFFLIPLLSIALVAWYRLKGGPGYPLDDSWIHLAFAKHFAHGAGFGINPGQVSTGSTSPLWAVLLSLGFLCGADHTVWPWLLGAVALSGCGLAAALVMQRWLQVQARHPRAERAPSSMHVAEPRARRLAPLATGLIVSATAGLVWSAAGAMEPPLFAALLLLAWSAWMRERTARSLPLWGLCAGLAALARPEGLLFAALLAILSPRRAAVLNLLVAGIVYSPYAIFCITASGRVLPSTFYAKTTQIVGGVPSPHYLAQSAGLLWQLSPPLVLLCLAGLLALAFGPHPESRMMEKIDRRSQWIRRLREATPLAPGILYVVALPLAYATLGRTFLFAGVAGNFGRYYFPLLPLLAIVGLGGLLARRGDAPPARVAARRMGSSAFVPALVGLVLIWNAAATIHHAGAYAHNVRDINSMQVEMARRLARDLPAGSLVAANDVGALAYFTDLRVLDLVGIVSPEVQAVLFPLRRQARSVRHQALLRLIVDLQPAAIVAFPHWYPEILQALARVREPLEEIQVPDNVTSAGAQLVAYRLRWAPSEDR